LCGTKRYKLDNYADLRDFFLVEMTWDMSHFSAQIAHRAGWRWWCRFSPFAAGNAWPDRMDQKPKPNSWTQLSGRGFVTSLPQERSGAALHGGVPTGRAETVAPKLRAESLKE